MGPIGVDISSLAIHDLSMPVKPYRDCQKERDRCGHPYCKTCTPNGFPHYNPEADKLAAVLQSIIDGCVHPQVALRRVSVDLAPIRAALKAYHESQ